MIGFAVLHLAPGGPLAQFALSPGMSQADLARIAEQMGLNRPLPVQYWEWLSRLLVGDWGHSYRDTQPVLVVIGSHFWSTLELMISSTLLAILLGTWIGVLGAVRRYSFFDSLATVGAMVALSIPTFWFGLVTIYLFSVKLGWLPAGSMFTIGNVKVIPNVSGSYRRGSPIGIYMQIYNAGVDQTTLRPSVDVEYVLLKDGKEIGKQVEDWRGNSDSGQRLTLARLIDSQSLATGDYSLEVRVKDRVSGQSLVQIGKFTVLP